ncbi:MAG: T9SS type A sorting domain-containing protein [Saprospiraceae bacterium]
MLNFTAHRSPLTAHRSPLTAHRSPLTAHRVALALLMVLWSLTGSKAQEACGTPDISLEQRLAFLEDIDSTSENAVASGSVAADGVWKVGVWFYHLRRTDGTSTKQNPDPNQAIAAVNGYFNGLFEFVVCGSTNIDNDDYYELDLGTDLNDLWADIAALNEPASDKCVRVFLLGGTSIYSNGVPFANGYGNDPIHYSHPGVFTVDMSNKTWAHEMGHFFGLPHTFLGGPSRQYVHHPTQPLNYPVNISGVTYTCHHTGDGFCDTPADPGQCSFSSSCQFLSCINSPFDPLGLPYNPDPTLLMSYYFSCSNRFSLEQLQFMRTLYLFHPDYAYLKPPPEACISPAYGHIERNCEDYNPLIPNPITPMVYVPVEVRDEAAPYCNPQDNKTNLLGRYLTKPCAMTGTRRWSLPDRNYINDPYNGVSTFDIVRINRHLLGLEPFTNPYQMIAADVNNSASITSFDMIRIRQLILGLITEFHPGVNWRYVPKFYTEDQAFWNQFSVNPFTTTVSDPFTGVTRTYKNQQLGLTVPNSVTWMDFVHLHTDSGLAGTETAWSFTGIKLGDVNCNAITEGSPLVGDDHEFFVDAGSLANVNFSGTRRIQVVASAPEEAVAWQFGVRYVSDSLSVFNLAAGTDTELFDEENISIAPGGSLNAPGHFRAIWYAENDAPVDINNKVLFEFDASTSQGMVDITEAFWLDKTVLPFFFYNEDGEIIPGVTLTLHIAEVPQGLRKPVLPGTASPSQSLRIKTYPVPFTSEVNFAFDMQTGGTVHLDIFDATGTLVSNTHTTFPAGPNELNVSDLASRPSGFYWYVLQVGDVTARGKISKK